MTADSTLARRICSPTCVAMVMLHWNRHPGPTDGGLRPVDQNTAPEASLASNEMYIAYFSRRSYDWSHYEAYDYHVADLEQRPELWHGRDYLVMTVKPRELADWQQFAGRGDREEIAVFEGSSGTSVRVLRLPGD